MKTIKLLPVFLILLYSCSDIKKNNSKKDTKESESISGQTAQTSIFPVTDFFRGQIADIKKLGVNPMKITRFNKRIDSMWLKVENMEVEFAPFLFPVIDSTNLAGMFTEKRFLDQTIDAFTFTYDPVKPLPDTFLLRRWDIYIDPNTNSVTRVYLVKKEPGNRTLQLTWQTNKSCRIVSISTDPAGIDYVEKEVTIKWDL